MALIRPSADLRNKYNEISKICHETKQPIYITKNGQNDLVILSNEAYEKYENENLNRLIEENFEKKNQDLEDFKKEVLKQIKKGLCDVDEGKYNPANEVFEELEAKFDLND